MPPAITNGSMAAVPIHQLALCLGPRAVRAMATAAGLNMCFLRMTSKYFDAIARPETANRKVIPKPVGLGVIISAKIKAVKIDDSLLVGALKMYENTSFVTQQAASKMSVEIAIYSGL